MTLSRDPASTPTVTDRRERLGSRLRRARRLLVCLDYDGTLAPLVEDPEEAAMLPAARQAVEALAACPSVTVAVVSGRSLADVRERVDIDGVAFAGNHGLKRVVDGERVVDPAAARCESQVSAVVDHVRTAVAEVPGCIVEDKGLTATVHFRQVPEEHVPAVKRAVATACADVGEGLTRSRGKEIVEIRPETDCDKGTAVEAFRAATADALPVYIGDDVTDEAAFRALGPDGVAVHVGDDAPAPATHRLERVEHVANFLDWARAVRDGAL